MSILPTTSSLTNAPTWDGERRVAGGALAGDSPALQGQDELTFGDFLSVLNPLQHIPVVSNIYRWITGDTIKPAARVIGGALYGGPVGLVTAALNAVVEEVKGSDIGGQLIAMVAPDRKGTPAPTTATLAAAEQQAAPAEGSEALLQLAADLRSGEATIEEPKPQPAAVPSLPGQARTLAFYQAHAGQRLPTSDGGRGSPTPKLAAAVQSQAPASQPSPTSTVEEKSGAGKSTNPPDGAPDAWFAAAMMRGLDRYRASQQLNRTAPQLDISQ